MTFNGVNYKYNYLRNSLAFRGREIDAKSVKIIMVGGSTTDERYKPEKLSIVGQLNENLKKKGIDMRIINAGIEGQSTRGHIANFNFWFNKIKNFNPEFIIYYIGINDTTLLMGPHSELQDGWIKNPNNIESFFDNLKSRSIIADLLRKIKHKYYTKDEKKRIVYDYDHSIKANKKNKITYLNYNQQKEIFNIERLISDKEKVINMYTDNIDHLYDLTNLIGATPIFINQPALRHEDPEILFLLNYSLIKHCNKKKYKCIDLAKNFVASDDFWWDRVHTTPKGSRAIAKAIYPKLIEFLEKKND